MKKLFRIGAVNGYAEDGQAIISEHFVSANWWKDAIAKLEVEYDNHGQTFDMRFLEVVVEEVLEA